MTSTALGKSSGGRARSRRSRARPNYVADFETTTDPTDCRVWGWGIANIADPENVHMAHTLNEFLEYISAQSSVVYFHNLKFDGTFIVDWLLKHGFSHQTGLGSLPPKGFRTLISDMGKFYAMTVSWENGHTTEFRDSLKKLPMSVMRIAQSFKLGEVKGEIDYEAARPIGHVMTDEERDYLRRDVSIVAKAMSEVLASGMTKLTVASDSLAEYKRLTTGDKFTRYFPVFNDWMDAELRRAYRGGFTYADERFKGRKVGSGIVLDVNSLYPHIMYSKPLPYGFPEFVNGQVKPTEARPLTIFSVTIVAKLKPNHIPCIQVKGNSTFMPTEYLKVIDEPTTIMLTNVDWDLYNEHYDIEVVEWGNGWRFQAVTGLFNSYIEKWSAVKAAETGGKKEIAKLHLNSLYGKFASNPNVTSKFPTLKNGAVHYKRGPDETRAPVYTPVGVFVTSWARDLTIRAAQANYDTFAYADTDSLHLLRDDVPDTIEVHPTKLGAWKFEYAFDSAFYIRAKAYLEHRTYKVDKDGERVPAPGYENHIAGVPESVTELLTFDDIKDGLTIDAEWVRKRSGDPKRAGKLTPKMVPGGIVLTDTPYNLKL